MIKSDKIQPGGSRRYGWSGTISEFLVVEQSIWIDSLRSHQVSSLGDQPSDSQITAWENCFHILKRQLRFLIAKRPLVQNWTIVFEYELHRERGRRPDVVILTKSSVAVLEFKDFDRIVGSHVDQASEYRRDLEHYHTGTHERDVNTFLVLTKASGIAEKRHLVSIISGDRIAEHLAGIGDLDYGSLEAKSWLEAEYNPLPSIVSAAKMIFDQQPLPRIRRALSAGIPEALRTMIEVCERARSAGERHLILLTGVPGAGKTLVGLQLVHHDHLNEVKSARSAVFLSGNGPLVKVLQHALGSKAFVQDVHGFLREYGGGSDRIPVEHILVFDEAQRAWDAQKVQASKSRSSKVSEPEDFLRLGSQMQGWAVIIGLVGEGQEIHDGEETGIGLWNEALSEVRETWHVHCPPELIHHFNYAKIVHPNPALCLTESVRSHVAEEVHNWVRTLLDGDLPRAGEIALRVQQQGFPIHVTRNLGGVEKYLKSRYSSDAEKRFGILASSRSKDLGQFEVENGRRYGKCEDVGAWYNDPPTSIQSCTRMSAIATEFQCQGLELDFPVVAWGNDLKWLNDAWHSEPDRYSKANNPHQLRINSYRVLLTRGRDGMAIFVPRADSMNPTYEALRQATSVTQYA